MTTEEFKIKNTRLEKEYEEGLRLAIENLKAEYLEMNAKFKIGDFVGNVTGTIKVEKMKCEIFRGSPIIVYTGDRYWKKGTEFIKTKVFLKRTLTQEHGIKQIL
jgi:hypothetical protein